MDDSKKRMEMPDESLGRHGKIARLPRAVREKLNQRLRDGESGTRLIKWLNRLPEVKAVLKRQFEGRGINDQNLSDWKWGGYREWLAKKEADELMSDMVGEGWPLEMKGKQGAKPVEKTPECESDNVARWFFPHYVALARRQLAAARDDGERWGILRTVFADLAAVRRSDHRVERLRIWREKSRKITEEDILAWVKAHPEIEDKIWPERALSFEERQRRIREILGTGDPEDFEASFDNDGPKEPENGPEIQGNSS